MRSKALQIYMKPGIPDDDLMLSIWDVAREYDRPQDVFRAMLRNGLKRMLENGELSDKIVNECNLKRPPKQDDQPHQQSGHFGPPTYPYPGGYPQPYPTYQPQLPMPAHAPHAPHHVAHPEQPTPHESELRSNPRPERVAAPAEATRSKPATEAPARQSESAGVAADGKKKSRIGDLM